MRKGNKMYIVQCVLLTIALFVLVYLCMEQLCKNIKATVEKEVVQSMKENIVVDWSIDVEIIDER